MNPLTFNRLGLSATKVTTRMAPSRLAAASSRTFATATAPKLPTQLATAAGWSQKWGKTLGLALGLGAAQLALGDATDFFSHEFVTHANPEDLADFYGSEDLMEIFSVFPFMANLMLRGAEFDDVGNIHARGLLGAGAMEIVVDFSEKEVDTTGDGEPDTIGWFNKRERFEDHVPAFLGGFALWQMTQNFGYHRMNDGTCVVYHQGEHFRGIFPVRLLFQLHAKYVIWATERYINSDAFGSEDRVDEAEEFRQNVPRQVFADFIAGLTKEVEKAQQTTRRDSERHKELEATIQRLRTVRANMDHANMAPPPRLHTLKSRKSHVGRVELILDDVETKDVIRTAMKQLGESKGKRPQPVTEGHHLHRRTTLSHFHLEVDADDKEHDE